MSRQSQVSRRGFMRRAVATTAGGLAALGAAAVRGQAGKVFKIGLIGCGGRGSGAMINCIDAGKFLGVDVRVTALADAFAERLTGARNRAKKAGQEVPASRCFAGYDAYKKLLDTDVDIVLMATPPNFRPAHVEATIRAGKHTFIEKPVAVDPVGCRRMFRAGELAASKGLSVVAGTCLRHGKAYRATHQVVADGALGRILGGVIYYCTGQLWFRRRQPGWSDADYMTRNWVSFVEMSGDHIVEQHIHTIDMLNWFMGSHPLVAIAAGGRARRQTGNQYDFFSTDFEYPDHVHVHSLCRQVRGCWNWGNGVHLVGEKGWTNADNGVQGAKEKVELPQIPGHDSMYVQEHVVLLDSILKGKPVNDTKDVTEATLTAVMARTSAYSGQKVTWEQLTDPNSKSPWYDLELKPTAKDFEDGKVVAPKDDVIPVPGK